MDTATIEKAVSDGRIIADKISRTKSLDELDALSAEIEEYSDFVNENFGVFNEIFAKREKFSDLAFYIHMAVKEKEDHIEYYSSHQKLRDRKSVV